MQRSSRSFRGNASPTSSHTYGRRMDAQHAALEDWESSFTQILSRTKQNIIRVNERYGSPQPVHEPRGAAGLPVLPPPSRVRDSLEYLGIAPLRSHKVGTEPPTTNTMQAEAHTSDELLSPLLQRLERLEASVLIQTQNYTGSSSGGEAETKALADHAYHGSPARGPGPSSTITSLAPRDTAVDRRVVALENKIEQVPTRRSVPAFVPFDGGSLQKHSVSPLATTLPLVQVHVQLDTLAVEAQDQQRHHAALAAALAKQVG